MINILEAAILFIIFILLQSIFINGVYELFKGGCVNDIKKGVICDGNLFYKINPSFFEKHKGETWTKPLYGCVKCMSSVYSFITFWPFVLYCFGFHFIEIGIYIADAISLVTVNYYIYKKI